LSQGVPPPTLPAGSSHSPSFNYSHNRGVDILLRLISVTFSPLNLIFLAVLFFYFFHARPPKRLGQARPERIWVGKSPAGPQGPSHGEFYAAIHCVILMRCAVSSVDVPTTTTQTSLIPMLSSTYFLLLLFSLLLYFLFFFLPNFTAHEARMITIPVFSHTFYSLSLHSRSFRFPFACDSSSF